MSGGECETGEQAMWAPMVEVPGGGVNSHYGLWGPKVLQGTVVASGAWSVVVVGSAVAALVAVKQVGTLHMALWWPPCWPGTETMGTKEVAN